MNKTRKQRKISKIHITQTNPVEIGDVNEQIRRERNIYITPNNS